MEETWRDIEARSVRDGRKKEGQAASGRGEMKHEDEAGGEEGPSGTGQPETQQTKCGWLAEEEVGGGGK